MSFLWFRVSQLLDYSKLSLRTPETQPDSTSPPRFARTLMRPRERRRLAGPSSCRRALSQTARLPSAPRNTGREPGVGGGPASAAPRLAQARTSRAPQTPNTGPPTAHAASCPSALGPAPLEGAALRTASVTTTDVRLCAADGGPGLAPEWGTLRHVARWGASCQVLASLPRAGLHVRTASPVRKDNSPSFSCAAQTRGA